MEALFIFILKSGGLLATFYFAYILLLRKETFFNSSRWFLIAGLLTSVILPFVVYTKVIWIDPAPVPVETETVYNDTKNYKSYADVASYSTVHRAQPALEEGFEINWNLVCLIVYSIGFAAFMIKFALDFYSLNSVLKGKKIEQQEDFKFIDVKENIAPFSYFDYIVYNSSLYTASELENILEHEKVHSDQHHTIDVLISRIFCILFWFNPIVWLYKKAILQNLEFIADSEAAKKISDKKAYQYTLLKITTHETCVAITNHFYQSLIKKRIVMLNKNQSKKRNHWKYYAIVPALAAFILLFQIQTIAQEKRIQKENVIQKDTLKEAQETFKITKNSTDEELKQLAEKLKASHNLDIEISDVKRNSEKELTAIQIRIKSETGKKQTIKIDGNKAIKDCILAVSTDNNGKKTVDLDTEGALAPGVINNERVVVRHFGDENREDPLPPAAPVAPVAPVFPQGEMPKAPDMSKMPKAPTPPLNLNDKVAMAKFEKDMAVFEKKMEAFEPEMKAFEKEVEEIMSKREIIFEKDMEKFQLAMEMYNTEMEKFQIDMNQNFNFDFDTKFQRNEMRAQAEHARLNAEEMRKQAEIMREHANEMRKHANELRKAERRNSKS
ncbi:M56 family metallopeptidase [Flavobacterium sp. HTF]|uniref:M56 family metallopeptidase n=1 Tax=Flavobacterium sp. HTF TaxID=2170732 RepID=UPI000D5D1FBB|nr:M56 family metallopeptidase [Flavobacterium sp. HTF]PWB23681.1 peptidase M56 [Flavobacterium sp. HTF]